LSDFDKWVKNVDKHTRLCLLELKNKLIKQQIQLEVYKEDLANIKKEIREINYKLNLININDIERKINNIKNEIQKLNLEETRSQIKNLTKEISDYKDLAKQIRKLQFELISKLNRYFEAEKKIQKILNEKRG